MYILNNKNMKNKKTKLSLLLFLVLGLATANAQEASVASGGNASGGGGFVSYSVGQLVYTTNTSTAGVVAQGVQQTYEISIVSGLAENNTIALNLSVFPNPTNDYLSLQISDAAKEDLIYQLLDLNGKLLESKKIINKTEIIYTVHLAPTTYFLKIIQNNKDVKTFKIIKN